MLFDPVVLSRGFSSILVGLLVVWFAVGAGGLFFYLGYCFCGVWLLFVLVAVRFGCLRFAVARCVFCVGLIIDLFGIHVFAVAMMFCHFCAVVLCVPSLERF